MWANGEVTTQEAAKRLGVTVDYVRQLIRQGDLKAVRPGREWHVLVSSVEAFKSTQRPVGRRPGSVGDGSLPEPEEGEVSTDEAARILDVTPAYIGFLVKKGVLEGRRPGRIRIIKLKSVCRYKENRPKIWQGKRRESSSLRIYSSGKEPVLNIARPSEVHQVCLSLPFNLAWLALHIVERELHELESYGLKCRGEYKSVENLKKRIVDSLGPEGKKLCEAYPLEGGSLRCSKCGQLRRPSEFNRDMRNPNGLSKDCVVCVRGRAVRYRANARAKRIAGVERERRV